MTGGTDSPLAPHAATPAELRERIEAERNGDPFLVFRDGDGHQRLVVLDPVRGRATVGRSQGNDVALVWDTEVSRLHAELERLGHEWTVGDDGLSRNGSFVNGQRVWGATASATATSCAWGRPRSTSRPRGRGLPPDPAPGGATGGAPDPDRTARRARLPSCAPTARATSRPRRRTARSPPSCTSVDAVKAHLRTLFGLFGLEALPQNQKRSVLALRALQDGVVSRREL